MASSAPTPAVSGPAEPVPVAVLARTSTLALQDPAASLRRQITSTREWLPPGFYVAGYFWDVESGGLDLDQRGHGHYEQFTAQGIPRDGGLADLLEEARSASPRFAAVVVEDIERASRDFYNSIKLERELSDQGIPLFATDEPADIKGVNPTTLLIRRVKQGFAEYFRLQLKEKVWKGLREHSEQGWNIGKVPYGYLPEKVTHPNPSKAAAGMSKTRLALDPDRAPVIEQIYTWRTVDKLAVNTIVGGSTPTWPPTRPLTAPGPSAGSPRCSATPNTPGIRCSAAPSTASPSQPRQWHWSPAPTHPAIVVPGSLGQGPGSRRRARHQLGRHHRPAPHRQAVLSAAVADAVQDLPAAHGRPHQNPPRPRPQRRLHLLHLHPRPHQPPPRRQSPRPSRSPSPPATTSSSAKLRTGLEAYAFTPGRKERLREAAPRRGQRTAGPHRRPGRRAQSPAQADRDRPGQPRPRPRHAAHRPGRHRRPGPAGPHPRPLHRTAPRTRSQRSPAQGPDPASPGRRRHRPDRPAPHCWPRRFHELPEPIQAELFTALDIQVLWNAPQHQATFFATITDTNISDINALLERGKDDPATTMPAPPATALTSNNPGARFTRHPMCRKLGPAQPDVCAGARPVCHTSPASLLSAGFPRFGKPFRQKLSRSLP